MDDDKGVTDFAVLVKNIKDNILAHLEFAELNARIQKAKYDALVKAGFNETQAIILCQK